MLFVCVLCGLLNVVERAIGLVGFGCVYVWVVGLLVMSGFGVCRVF